MRYVIIMLFGLSFCNAQNVTQLRKNLVDSYKDEAVAKSSIKELEKKNTAIEKGYLGMYQMIMANHSLNPISKLTYFKKGKAALEKAIAEDPNNVELRYLRLSVQLNVPSMLNYKMNLVEDRAFILQQYHMISDASLKTMIKSSEFFTAKEKQLMK